MLTIGIDPDLHDLAVGVWEDGKPHSAHIVHVPKKTGVKQHAAVVQMVMAMDERFFEMEDAYYPHAIDPHAIAVEGPTLQRTGLKQHKRPQDIVILGNVAGAALLASCYLFPEAEILFPTPEEWKGQIPKAVMQARLYAALGWGYRMRASESYAEPLKIPEAFTSILPGQWKHVGDALLLARWAAEQCK